MYTFVQAGSNAGADRDSGAIIRINLATGATKTKAVDFAVSGGLFFDASLNSVLGLHSESDSATLYAFDATTLEPRAVASAGGGLHFVSNTVYDAAAREFFFYAYAGGPAWVRLSLQTGGVAGVSPAAGMNAFASSWDSVLQRFAVLQDDSIAKPPYIALATRDGNVTKKIAAGLPAAISGPTPWAYSAAEQSGVYIGTEDRSLKTFIVTVMLAAGNATHKVEFADYDAFCLHST